jgi:hypothetical protein
MAYVNFMKINTSTGELMLKGSCPEEMVSIQKHADNELIFIPTEEQWTSITYDLYYYNGTEFVSRVYSPITKSGPMSFSNIPYQLPAGVTMELENNIYAITEDHVDLNINLPGTYVVTFKNFPYLDAKFEVIIV